MIIANTKMIQTDILNIILSYCDLNIYYSLIDEKRFTLTKYHKLQNEIDTILSSKIKKFWEAMNGKIFLLTNNNMKRYLYIKNQYDTIKKLIEALEICHLFVYTGLIENFDKIRWEDSNYKFLTQCVLIGYIVGNSINSDKKFSFNTEVVIDWNYGSLLSITDGKSYHKITPSKKLLELYIETVKEFTELLVNTPSSLNTTANSIFNGNFMQVLTGITNTISSKSQGDNWNSKYEDLKELVGYKLS